jgi:hypothetical protein
MERPAKVAVPDASVDAVVVPARVPPPLVMLTLTETPGCPTAAPVASCNCTEGAVPNVARLFALKLEEVTIASFVAVGVLSSGPAAGWHDATSKVVKAPAAAKRIRRWVVTRTCRSEGGAAGPEYLQAEIRVAR